MKIFRYSKVANTLLRRFLYHRNWERLTQPEHTVTQTPLLNVTHRRRRYAATKNAQQGSAYCAVASNKLLPTRVAMQQVVIACRQTAQV